MLGDSGRSERAAGRYLPYVGHIGPQTCLLESGAVMAMAHVEGTPFELADHAARNARLRLLNTLYRNLADDNVIIHTHLIRYPDLTSDTPRQFRSSFAHALDSAYPA
jgi:type IV secretion system protein VirB4